MDLHLNDLFWTLQGEGAHAGRRALFVRMPFCNLSCSWCDTNFNTQMKWAENDFVNFALKEPARFAVITGGEPMLHKDTPSVVRILKSLGFEIACETNGTYPIVDGIDWATCSPKKDIDYYVHPQAWDRVHEFKYVVDKQFDFGILARHRHDDHRRYSLSPEFNEMEANLEKIFDFIKEHPRWRLSLQTHKWIGLP